MRWVYFALTAALAIGVAGYCAFSLSPWPTVLLVRYAFDKDAGQRNRALEKHLPDNVVPLREQQADARHLSRAR